MYHEGRSQLHTGRLQVKLGDLLGLFIWNTKTDCNNYTKRHFKISVPCENEAAKHDLVKLKVEFLKVFCCHGNKSTILLFKFNF